jgi:hypothetical protein
VLRAKATSKAPGKPAGKVSGEACGLPLNPSSGKGSGQNLRQSRLVKVAGKTVLKPAVNAKPVAKLVGKALPVAEKVPLKAAAKTSFGQIGENRKSSRVKRTAKRLRRNPHRD